MGTKIYKHQVQSTDMKRASIDRVLLDVFVCLFIGWIKNQNVTIQIAS